MPFFILIFKGTDNDGPNVNIEQLRYCSSSLTKVGYGTLHPPVDDSYSDDWGEKVFERDNADDLSFQQYCMLNSCTDEGLDSIAVYNKFSDKWEMKKGTFNDKTSMALKRFVLLKLYAKHRDKRKYHLDPMEGGSLKSWGVPGKFLCPTKSRGWFHIRLFDIHSRAVPHCRIESWERYYGKAYYWCLRHGDRSRNQRTRILCRKNTCRRQISKRPGCSCAGISCGMSSVQRKYSTRKTKFCHKKCLCRDCKSCRGIHG